MAKKQTKEQSCTMIPKSKIKNTSQNQPPKIKQSKEKKYIKLQQKLSNQNQLQNLIQKKSIQYKCEYLSFLASIGQKYGLIFNQNIRKEINKKYHFFTKKLQYNHQIGPSQKLVTVKHQWKRLQQQNKIKQMFLKNKIELLKNIYKNKIDQFQKHITKFFIEISCIFAQQVTNQLYDILFDQIKIFLDNGIKQENNRKIKFRQLGDEIGCQPISFDKKDLQKIKKYFYFGYYFSIPQILIIQKNQKQPKYARVEQLSKYQLQQFSRQKNGPFSNFIQKSGQVLFSFMYELNIKYQFTSNTQLLPTVKLSYKQK